MKRGYIYILGLLSLFTLGIALISCQRQTLEDPSTYLAQLPVSVDYTNLGISPTNTTLLFYDREDGSLKYEYYYENNDDEIEYYVHPIKGKYDVVIFNELRRDIQNVSVVGHTNLSTLRFEVNPISPIRVRSSDKVYIAQPAMFGVRLIENLVVTDELVDYTRSKSRTKSTSATTKNTSNMLMNVVVDPKISTLEVVAHIKNLKYARMPALADLNGIARRYIPHTDNNEMEPSVMQFTLDNPIYDDASSMDGIISAKVDLLGVLGDRKTIADQPANTPIELDILFMLIDKEKTEVSISQDITQSIIFDTSLKGTIKLLVEINFTESLPEVIPEDSDGSGFGSSITDWGKPIEVPL